MNKHAESSTGEIPMVKDVYLFTNGVLMVFDEQGRQLPWLGGTFTKDLRNTLLNNMEPDARITLSRWKKGFFLLTKEEFSAVEFNDDILTLKFKRVSADETDSAN